MYSTKITTGTQLSSLHVLKSDHPLYPDQTILAWVRGVYRDSLGQGGEP